jgi:hypothetical protein
MTSEKLKKEILNIVKTLRGLSQEQLAKCIEENWNKTALDYSKELNSWKPSGSMEKELHLSFDKELARLEIVDGSKIKILDSLEKRRVLQTAPHLVVTENPRMLCINWLGSLGTREEDFYVVAMFSGIPFSNSFRPGRIIGKNISVNLFPSNMQDGLVFRSIIQNKLIESRKNIPAQIDRLLPEAIPGESYTKWALSACQNIERKILGKENLIFLDINEVVSNYLVQVLKNKNHVLYKIFFNPKSRAEFIKIFPNETIFYCPVMNGKFETMEKMIFSLSSLKSRSKEISLTDPGVLISELEHGRICPALIVSFLALAFLNQFKCFGSFYQVEYLPLYQQKLAKLKFLKEFNIEKIPTANLTTGVFREEANLYPADIIMNINNKKFKIKEETLFGELLLPLKDKLIHGRTKKNEERNN